MVTIAGGYTPGSAWGTHSGFDVGGAPMGGGGGPPTGAWGLLRKQQQMRDRMAQAQLDLIAEQINASRRARYEQALQTQLAEKARMDEVKWREFQAKEQGDRAMAMAWGLTRGQGMDPRNTPGNVAAAGGMDPTMMHEGMMQSGRILGQLGAQALAGAQPLPEAPSDIGGGFGYWGVGGDTFTGPTYGEGVTVPGMTPSPLGGTATKTIPPGTELGTYGELGGAAGPMGPQQPSRGVRATIPGSFPGYRQIISQYGHEEGTLPGTVPRTGPAIVHEGEAIVPEEQVDAPLLAHLRRDALRKGVPLGQAKGSKYKCGTLKYQEGSLGEDPWAALRKWFGGAGATQEGMQEWQARYGQGAVPPKGLGNLPVVGGPSPPPAVQGPSAVSTRGPAVIDMRRQFDDVWAAASEAERKALKPIRERLGASSPVTREVMEQAVKEGGDDAARILWKMPKGKTLLGAIGGVAAMAAASAGAEELPWWKMMLLANPVTGPALGVQTFGEKLMAGEESPFRAAGQTAKELIGGVGAGVFGGAGEFARGVVPSLGAEPPAPEGLPVDVGEGVAGPMVPTGPAPGSLEAVLGRTGVGDFGTPEAPLELRGEPEPPFPESYEDLRALPEDITARHKAQMNMVQAERILDHLQFHGHELDPGSYQMMQDQAKQKMGLAQMYGKQVQSREQYAQQGQKLIQEMTKKLTEIEARGEQTRTTEQLKAQNRMTLTRLRESATMVRQLVGTMVSKESAGRRSDAKELLIQMIQGAQAQKGVTVSDDAAILDRLQAMEAASPEEQEMFIASLEQALSGLR